MSASLGSNFTGVNQPGWGLFGGNPQWGQQPGTNFPGTNPPGTNLNDIAGQVARIAAPLVVSMLSSPAYGGLQGQPLMGQGTIPQSAGLNPLQALGNLYGLYPGNLAQNQTPFASQNWLTDIGAFLRGPVQQLSQIITQQIAQQLTTLISGVLQSFAASPQLLAQAVGVQTQTIQGQAGGTLNPTTLANWLANAAQSVAQLATQQVAQQLPYILQTALTAYATTASSATAQPLLFGIPGLQQPLGAANPVTQPTYH
jgi:hypothetical protein